MLSHAPRLVEMASGTTPTAASTQPVMRRRRDGASSHDRMKNGVSRASVDPHPFVAGSGAAGRGTVPSMNVWSSANRMIVRSLMNCVVGEPGREQLLQQRRHGRRREHQRQVAEPHEHDPEEREHVDDALRGELQRRRVAEPEHAR